MTPKIPMTPELRAAMERCGKAAGDEIVRRWRRMGSPTLLDLIEAAERPPLVALGDGSDLYIEREVRHEDGSVTVTLGIRRSGPLPL